MNIIILRKDNEIKKNRVIYLTSGPTWFFGGSYLWFSACYVDENNTIRFSIKIPIGRFSKMSTF